MSGLNFNSTDNKPATRFDYEYVETTFSFGEAVNDYNLGGYSNLIVTAGNTAQISGIVPEYDGQVVVITNSMSADESITILHLSVSSAASNRIDFAADGSANKTLSFGNSVVLKYDNVNSKWWPIGSYK
jgi:hypothetical protein